MKWVPTPTPLSYCLDTGTLGEVEGSGYHRAKNN